MQLAMDASILNRPDRAEEALVEAARRDRSAFVRLYHLHYPAVASYIQRRTGDPHLTDDLVADVFLSAMKALPRYRYRGVPFRAWLMRIATNRINRWARRERPRAMRRLADVSTASTASTGEDDPGLDADADVVRTALLTLAPRHQTVLAMHYFEELSIEEMAQVLGCRGGTVKSRLFRARTALRLRLEGRTDR